MPLVTLYLLSPYDHTALSKALLFAPIPILLNHFTFIYLLFVKKMTATKRESLIIRLLVYASTVWLLFQVFSTLCPTPQQQNQSSCFLVQAVMTNSAQRTDSPSSTTAIHRLDKACDRALLYLVLSSCWADVPNDHGSANFNKDCCQETLRHSLIQAYRLRAALESCRSDRQSDLLQEVEDVLTEIDESTDKLYSMSSRYDQPSSMEGGTSNSHGTKNRTVLKKITAQLQAECNAFCHTAKQKLSHLLQSCNVGAEEEEDLHHGSEECQAVVAGIRWMLRLAQERMAEALRMEQKRPPGVPAYRVRKDAWIQGMQAVELARCAQLAVEYWASEEHDFIDSDDGDASEAGSEGECECEADDAEAEEGEEADSEVQETEVEEESYEADGEESHCSDESEHSNDEVEGESEPNEEQCAEETEEESPSNQSQDQQSSQDSVHSAASVENESEENKEGSEEEHEHEDGESSHHEEKMEVSSSDDSSAHHSSRQPHPQFTLSQDEFKPLVLPAPLVDFPLQDLPDAINGIPNEANFCFMHSCIQALFTLPRFRAAVLRSSVTPPKQLFVEPEGRSLTAMDRQRYAARLQETAALKRLLQLLFSPGPNAEDLRSARLALAHLLRNEFPLGQQDDANGFMNRVIDALDGAVRKVIHPDGHIEYRTLGILSDITHAFQTHLYCTGCGASRTKSDLTMSIQCSAEQLQPEMTLHQLLSEQCQDQPLEHAVISTCTCPPSIQPVKYKCHIVRGHLLTCPSLIVQVPRNDYMTGGKHFYTLNNFSHFDWESRNLEGNHSDGPVIKTSWECHAVVVHIGERLDRGHYVAYAKRHGRWFRFSDSDVKECPSGVGIEEILKIQNEGLPDHKKETPYVMDGMMNRIIRRGYFHLLFIM